MTNADAPTQGMNHMSRSSQSPELDQTEHAGRSWINNFKSALHIVKTPQDGISCGRMVLKHPLEFRFVESLQRSTEAVAQHLNNAL